jgi:phosphoribosylformylglycinamidine synthase subunit PurL
MSFDTATLERHGLTSDEYARIVRALGREPSITELGIFSVMWSEHCSYKSSRIHLKKLPTRGPRVLQGPGENAGAVDIGDGLAAVFKIESHNHPSFIEPYQGAATGVGGIIRDIFTMGARPIALLNSLRFGSLDGPTGARTRRIMEGVVAGIAGYGNSIGIATVGGEIAFDDCYAGNPLVNVMCLGIVEKRPAVQVGDPFMEKLLLEACLELMATDALVGVQDMGAAGLTCSTCEMGARGGAGVEIDVQYVPQRETGMSPYEIMLSESQERMLLAVKRGREAEVERIFDKWDLHASRIGVVTADALMRVKNHGEVVAEIPNTALVDDAPLYDRPTARPAYLDEVGRLDLAALKRPAPREAFFALLTAPSIASKRWVYRQYDTMVRTNTLVLAGMGAGVVRIKGTPRALAMSTDGNGRYCYLDPRKGAMLAVAEAARNVACAGALPIGATNCLNFGNPQKPEIMWQLVQAIEGIAEACRALEVPITGGNVSLYNETDGTGIYPTPIIGVVGVIEDASAALGRVFRAAGREIVLLGEGDGRLDGSEYLKSVHDVVAGQAPSLDLARESALIHLLVEAASRRLVESAHDCADGGVAVTLAECAFDSGGIGCTVDLPPAAGHDGDWKALGTLFGESAGRAIVTVAPGQREALEQLAKEKGVPLRVIGTTGGARIQISVDGAGAIDCSVEEAEQLWSSTLGKYFEGRAA